MSWVSVAVLAGGTAASVGGGILSRNDALANATAQAQARNASLQSNIGILNGYEGANQSVFNTNLLNYAPAAQAKSLADAQTTRGDNNAANITAEDPNSAPIQQDASPATRGDLAKRMLAVHDAATDRARAVGALGGYSDVWNKNQIANQQASNDIGVNNNYAEGRKALVNPEGDLAAAAAYQPPSIWGPILQGAGSIASAAGGAGVGGALKAGTSNPVNVGSATVMQ